MIKRSYFASYNKYHDDGKLSFSWRHFTFTTNGLFANSEKVFADALEEARISMAASPGRDDLVHCIAFNRI
jgi:hypothetical protein